MIPFDLSQLEALAAIAEEGSFRAAAERLAVTQPTISMRIRDLELSLGVQLFDRSGHRAILSEQGWETLRYAQRMIAMARELHTSVTSGEVAGVVHVGAADTFALNHLPALLAELERRYPRLRIDLTIDHSVRLNALLRREGIDLAFLTMPEDAVELHLEKLHPVELSWVASPALTLPKGDLSARHLMTMPILTNPAPSHLHSSIQDWFAAEGETPERLHTCNNLTVMMKLTAAGFGVSLLPTALAAAELATGELREIKTRRPVPPHMFYLARRRKNSAPHLRFVVDVAHEILARVR